MKIILHKLFMLTAVVSLFLAGCQKQEILMSASKVDSQLQSTWQKVDMTYTASPVNWKFNDGKVYLIKNENILATGDYRVDASVAKVKVITSGFPNEGFDYMNGKWSVISLDDDILVMADDYSGGTLEVEFTKIK